LVTKRDTLDMVWQICCSESSFMWKQKAFLYQNRDSFASFIFIQIHEIYIHIINGLFMKNLYQTSQINILRNLAHFFCSVGNCTLGLEHA
jgi:hypothetical protein